MITKRIMVAALALSLSSQVRAECTGECVPPRPSIPITIIENMKREKTSDHLPPCNAPMNDARPLPSNWPCVGFQPPPTIADKMYREWAASYYADPEAQYYRGLRYLEEGNARTAERWLALSAKNNNHRAQALLGGMLFKGDLVPRNAARGLFWLTVAKKSAGPDEGWITDMHASALAQATDREKTMALRYWMDCALAICARPDRPASSTRATRWCRSCAAAP
jgi:hypothetical protein